MHRTSNPRFGLFGGLLFVLFAGLTTPPATASDLGRPHPQAPAELNEFGFLIGHWQCDVRFMNPDWKTFSEGKASWSARYTLDGWAIQDDFRGGFAENYLATTFRAYNVPAKKWNAVWLDAQRGIWSKPLIEHHSDETGISLRTGMRALDPQGKPTDLLVQYSFYDIQADRFRWKSDASMDEGETWIRETITMTCSRTKKAS